MTDINLNKEEAENSLPLPGDGPKSSFDGGESPRRPQGPIPHEGSFSDPPPNPSRNPRPLGGTRRVGTLTMGVALIAAGVCAILYLFFPRFDIIMAAKLSPLVLVILGAEIIINSLIFKGAKLKYDLLSGFVCFLLICGSITAVAVPVLYQQWGPNRHRMNQSIQLSVNDLCYEQLKGISSIQSLTSRIYLEGEIHPKENATYQDLRPTDTSFLYIDLAGDSFTDKNSFAAECRRILDQLQKLPVTIQSTRFYYENRELSQPVRYELEVNNRFSANLDAKGLAGIIEDRSYDIRVNELTDQMEEMRQSYEEQLTEQEEAWRSQIEELQAGQAAQTEEYQAQIEELEAQYQEQISQLEEEYSRQLEDAA